MNPNREKCKNPRCDRKEIARGLCRSCYSGTQKIVKEGYISWGELESQGKVKKPNTAERRRMTETLRSWILGATTKETK